METVRELTERDHDSVLVLVDRARARGEAWVGSWEADLLKLELLVAKGWAIGPEGAVEGFLLARPPGSAWEITLVAVDPAFQKQGHFKALFDQLTRRAAGPIWLEVRADNESALAAYQKAGFQEVGRRPQYYPDGQDALLLSFGDK